MIAEILATGDEISTGSVIDTNSAYIAEKLEEIGIMVTRHTCVGDDMNMLVSLFEETGARADIAVVTGGLGPTDDDLTSEAASRAAGVDLVQNKSALLYIENYFRKKSWTVSGSNLKQAMLPKGAESIANLSGTAPGFIQTIGKCLFYFLPGVPVEMQNMLRESVIPLIKKTQKKNRLYNKIKTISLFGLSESIVGERLSDMTGSFPGIKVGFRAAIPEMHVKLYGRGKNKNDLNKIIEQATEQVLKKLGNYVFSVEGNSIEVEVGKLLFDKKSTVAIAESCTGGLISHWLTNVSGSSDYFLFSGVTYTNQAKTDVLGVSPDIIKTYGAVHENTVKEMAEGARKISGATYGLATSGIAGPAGGTKDKPVGTVCIGLATPDHKKGYTFRFYYNSRLKNKKMFAMKALDVLRQELSGISG